jgi:hypothetical protein
MGVENVLADKTPDQIAVHLLEIIAATMASEANKETKELVAAIDYGISAIKELSLIKKAWPQPWSKASDEDYKDFCRAMTLFMRDKKKSALERLARKEKIV